MAAIFIYKPSEPTLGSSIPDKITASGSVTMH